MVTFLLSGVAFIIGLGFLFAVILLEPIVADKYYKRWHDKRRVVCSMEREEERKKRGEGTSTSFRSSASSVEPQSTGDMDSRVNLIQPQ